jgi:hypothetical protein
LDIIIAAAGVENIIAGAAIKDALKNAGRVLVCGAGA